MGSSSATSRQKSLFEDYDGFIEKFKPKKTTDDCYTPENIYNGVLNWVVDEYGINRDNVIRPFYPGGDYESEEYPEGYTVVDNPPFSILSEIVKYYNARSVRYFLFAPCLTNFQARDCSHVIADCNITYENGAVVRTAFVTNLDTVYKVRTANALRDAIEKANDENVKARRKQLPKYKYPDHVITAARVSYMAKHRVEYGLKFTDGFCRIGALDAQRAAGKSIFGDGYLLSDDAAAEHAAAEHWQLSERELKLVEMLGKGERDE